MILIAARATSTQETTINSCVCTCLQSKQNIPPAALSVWCLHAGACDPVGRVSEAVLAGKQNSDERRHPAHCHLVNPASVKQLCQPFLPLKGVNDLHPAPGYDGFHIPSSRTDDLLQDTNQMLLPQCLPYLFSEQPSSVAFHRTRLRTRSVAMLAKPMLQICIAAVLLPETPTLAASLGREQPQGTFRGILSRHSLALRCPIWTMARLSAREDEHFRLLQHTGLPLAG